MANILGVRVDKVTMDQALGQCLSWLNSKVKKVIVTPNIEFTMIAQNDFEFKKILNQSDLAIPDSTRLGWAYSELCEKNFLLKILKWPLFLFPSLFKDLPVVTGVDLMDQLCRLSNDRGFRIGLLGGKEGVAEKCAERLKVKYKNLKVVLAISGGVVKSDGSSENLISLPQTDILFVAFGAPKQEKWIHQNITRVDSKLFMGVGGAFDYLSGEVSRAPKWLRSLGLEWLYRLIKQPWRIKRFGSLVQFIILIGLT